MDFCQIIKLNAGPIIYFKNRIFFRQKKMTIIDIEIKLRDMICVILRISFHFSHSKCIGLQKKKKKHRYACIFILNSLCYLPFFLLIYYTLYGVFLNNFIQKSGVIFHAISHSLWAVQYFRSFQRDLWPPPDFDYIYLRIFFLKLCCFEYKLIHI